MREELLSERSSSRVSKKQRNGWTRDEEDTLYEACFKYGTQWDVVSSYVNRDKKECIGKWKCPIGWKTFGMISWPDGDIIQLLDFVSQPQCASASSLSTLHIDWLLVAAQLNEHEWRYTAQECCEVWKEVDSMPISRMGDFSAAEDCLIGKRKNQNGARKGFWRELSNELKRSHRQLSKRWETLQAQLPLATRSRTKRVSFDSCVDDGGSADSVLSGTDLLPTVERNDIVVVRTEECKEECAEKGFEGETEERSEETTLENSPTPAHTTHDFAEAYRTLQSFAQNANIGSVKVSSEAQNNSSSYDNQSLTAAVPTAGLESIRFFYDQ